MRPAELLKRHPADGTDEMGTCLPVTIRIGCDGQVYFHDITAALIPVALSLCPDDPVLRQRLAAAEAFREESPR